MASRTLPQKDTELALAHVWYPDSSQGIMPRVFISYSHDNPAHSEAVRRFADCLRANGFDAWIDQYAVDPDEGWPRWMQNELDRADFVLLVPTATYLRRWKGAEEPRSGHGATWEGLVLTNRLYMAHGKAKGMRCVLVGEASVEHIPEPLKGHSWFQPPAGCEKLERYLRALPVTAEAPPLAPLPPLEGRWTEPDPEHWNRRRLLEELLKRAFTNHDLYRILAYIPGGDRLRKALPSTLFAQNDWVAHFVDLAEQEGDIVRAELWEALRNESPNRKQEFLALESMWR